MPYLWLRSTCVKDRSTTAAIEIVVFLMQVYTQCSGRQADSPCSQCLGDDLRPFCGSKALSMFGSLILTGELAIPSNVHQEIY